MAELTKVRDLDDIKSEILASVGLEPPLPTHEQLHAIVEHAERVSELLLRAMDDPGMQELLAEQGIGKFLKTLIDPKAKN